MKESKNCYLAGFIAAMRLWLCHSLVRPGYIQQCEAFLKNSCLWANLRQTGIKLANIIPDAFLSCPFLQYFIIPSVATGKLVK
jgi:hypothetical protein